MTVYVDDMRAPFGRMIMCHMIADTEAELHQTAGQIGMARRWYQGDHYDLSLGMRAKAVAAGAVEITWRQAGTMMAHFRETGAFPKLEEVARIAGERSARIRAAIDRRQALTPAASDTNDGAVCGCGGRSEE